MQTPQGVFCRAIIMLAAIVALPYMAVFGLRVPDELWDMIPSEWIPPALLATTQAPIAIPLEPELQYRAEPKAGTRPPTLPRRVSPAAPSAPPNPPEMNWVDFDETPLEPPQTVSPKPESLVAADVEARLHELGAVDMRLEPWGGELYRFEGRFAIDSEAALSRYFSAIDANPDAARRKVLAQVESWRAQR